jgi:hypothetical protein
MNLPTFAAFVDELEKISDARMGVMTGLGNLTTRVATKVAPKLKVTGEDMMKVLKRGQNLTPAAFIPPTPAPAPTLRMR